MVTGGKSTRRRGARRRDQLRVVRFRRGFTATAPGSALVEMGRTRVLCTASVTPEVPPWRRESGLGWVTAEYTMLPGATNPRRPRAKVGHTDSRGTEIQRLIGRVLRAAVDMEKLSGCTITVDCDVLDADGGTRTAAINGGMVALVDAVRWAQRQKYLRHNPVRTLVGAVSVGIVGGRAALDLDYEWDSTADVDLNVAMTEHGELVEIQGTAEQAPFRREQLDRLLDLAGRGIRQITAEQRRVLRLRR